MMTRATIRILCATLLLWAIFLTAWFARESPLLLEVLPLGQVIGTLLMFALLPPYLWLMAIPMHRRASEAVDALASIANRQDTQRVRARLNRISMWGLPFVLLSLVFGASQNQLFISRMFAGASFEVIDVVFVCGNIVLWLSVGLLLVWRLPIGFALSQFAQRLDLDIYRLDVLRPMARVATTDVLAVAGAMAFMPMQSLDAEFRVENYGAGLMVGACSAIALFLLPLWGLRTNITRRKAARVAELREQLAATARDDITLLEPISAHINRIQDTPSLPIDTQVVTRIFAYGIIPPLAWVAAALVENLIDTL